MDFLQGVPEPRASRHIVVVTDGPDTCQAGPDAPCSAVTSADILSRIDQADAPIAVHFVQFESAGYPGRDSQQLEVACASGGHYRFINSGALDSTGPALIETLTDALMAVRTSMRGTLHVVAELADLGVAADPGQLVLLTGVVKLDPDQWGWSSATDLAKSWLRFGMPGTGWSEDVSELDDRLPLWLP